MSAALLLGLVAVSGCVDSTETGMVAFFVKDAPSDDFTTVVVDFDRVEVHRAGADDNEETEDDDEDEGETNATTTPNGTNETEMTDPEEMDDDRSSWTVVVDENRSVDLKNFSGDARAFLGQAEVEAGKYTQIRIHVRDAYGIMDGERVELELPSDTLKVVRPWTVEPGNVTVLTVDFDLDKSLKETGQGTWMLRPVLKLAIERVDASTWSGQDETVEGADGRRRNPGPPY